VSLATLAILGSALGILVTGALAALFLRDPVRGMAAVNHRAEQLPQVMADRYIAFAVLAVGATVYADLKVIAVLFAVFAFMGLADAVIYARAGYAWMKHFAAGVAAAAVAAVALAALFGETI